MNVLSDWDSDNNIPDWMAESMLEITSLMMESGALGSALDMQLNSAWPFSQPDNKKDNVENPPQPISFDHLKHPFIFATCLYILAFAVFVAEIIIFNINNRMY